MKSTMQHLPGSQAEFLITATAEQMEEFKKEAKEKLNNPEATDTQITYEAIQLAAPKLYAQCVQEHEVSPITQANSVILGEDPIQVKFTVDIYPIFELKMPQLELEKQETSVSDEELEAALKNISREYGEFTSVEDAPAQNGDRLTIKFSGEVDGESPQELNAEDFPLELGSKTFIPGFEDELVGTKAGESKTFDITFPEDYHAEKFAGTLATFTVDVKSITRNQAPELSDEFIKKITQDQITNLEDLKVDVKQKLTQRKELQQQQGQDMLIADKLAELNEMTIPETMRAAEVKFMKDSLKNHLEQNNLTIEKYLEQLKIDEQKLDQDLEKESLKRLRVRLCLLEYAKQAKITVDENKIDIEKLKEATSSDEEFNQALAVQKTEMLLTLSLAKIREEFIK